MGEQGKWPLLSPVFYYVKKSEGFCTVVMFLPRGYLSLYLTFSPKLSSFSLSFSLLLLALMVQQHVPLINQGMLPST